MKILLSLFPLILSMTSVQGWADQGRSLRVDCSPRTPDSKMGMATVTGTLWLKKVAGKDTVYVAKGNLTVGLTGADGKVLRPPTELAVSGGYDSNDKMDRELAIVEGKDSEDGDSKKTMTLVLRMLMGNDSSRVVIDEQVYKTDCSGRL